MGPSVERVLTVCLNGSVPLIKMAAMLICGKTFKTFLLQNQESFESESWYLAFGTQSLPSFLNDDGKLTFYLFTARSTLRRYIFVWRKC